jgi:hypothetical protein
LSRGLAPINHAATDTVIRDSQSGRALFAVSW